MSKKFRLLEEVGVERYFVSAYPVETDVKGLPKIELNP